MQILAILIASLSLIAAQFPFPFNQRGFRNARPPLATSASKHMPYVSIPIVLMPDGQMVQKQGPINYKYLAGTNPLMQAPKYEGTVIEDTPPHYQFALTSPSVKQNKMPDAMYTIEAQKNLRSIDLNSHINTQVIHPPQFQIQRQRNNPSQQHVVLSNPSKQHVVNFLNFASQVGSNVLSKQLRKDISTIHQGSVQDFQLKKLPNHASYIVQGISYAQAPQTQTSSQDARAVQNLPLITFNSQQQGQGQQNQNQVQFVVPQQYAETSDPKHPFQGIHLQESDPNTQEINSGDGQSIYNKINARAARAQASQQTDKQPHINYGPQYQSVILQPQNAHISLSATKNGDSETHLHRAVQTDPSYHRSPQETQTNRGNIQQQTVVIPHQHKTVKAPHSAQSSPHYEGYDRNSASFQTSQVFDGSERNNPHINYKISEVSKQEAVPAFDYSYIVNPNHNLEGHTRQRDLVNVYENQKSVGIIPATHYNGQPDLSGYHGQTGYFSYNQNENRRPQNDYAPTTNAGNKQESATKKNKDANYTPDQHKNSNQPLTYVYDHFSSNDQRSKVAEKGGYSHLRNQSEESPKLDTETEEDTDYKVVYIPLDILKNILGNSVDGQKVENVS